MIGSNIEENEMIFEQGMRHYQAKEWEKAYDCFQTVEMTILNGIGEKLKDVGRIESAGIYFHRAEKVKLRGFKLAPEKSYFLRYFLIITGVIAIICTIWSVLLFPTIQFLFLLIALLIDLMAFLIILPFAIVKWATSRRTTSADMLQKIALIENAINQPANNPAVTELQGFLKRENLRRKRAQLAQKLVQYEYTDAQLTK